MAHALVHHGTCASPLDDFYHQKFLKNRIDFARLHELGIFYNIATFKKDLISFRAKLLVLKKVMLNHLDVEWLWWMDNNAIFMDMTFEMMMEKYGRSNLIVYGFYNLL